MDVGLLDLADVEQTMTDEGELNIFRCLDFIRDNAPAYAQAKAQRVYLENFRKSKKAMLMRDAELRGHKTAAMQEREAYADPSYIETLVGLQEATENEERLRWLIVGAEAKIEAWRTIEATKRAEARNL
jgi:23S rRNA maturation mini-RNase III